MPSQRLLDDINSVKSLGIRSSAAKTVSTPAVTSPKIPASLEKDLNNLVHQFSTGTQPKPDQQVFNPVKAVTDLGASLYNRSLLSPQGRKNSPYQASNFIGKVTPEKIKGAQEIATNIGLGLTLGSPEEVAAAKGVTKAVGSGLQQSGNFVENTINAVKKLFGGKTNQSGEELVQKVASKLRGSQDETITGALNKATLNRGEQKVLYTRERGVRITKSEQAFQEAGGGLAGHKASLSALKGELPKIEGKPLKLSTEEINNYLDTIQSSTTLKEFQKVHARKEFLNLALGKTPTPTGIKFLNSVFGNNFVQDVSKEGFLDKASSLLNVPRALRATADFSASLRQALFAISKPKQYLSAFRNQFKYFASEGAYQKLQKDIASRPTFDLMKTAKVALTDFTGSLSNQEENFASKLTGKIPLVKQSGRAYTGMLNQLRADLFDDFIRAASNEGRNINDYKFLTDLGSFVNDMTGRGNAPNALRAPIVNSLFFSPRLAFSRISFLNPVSYVKLDPFVRRQKLKSLFSLTAIGMSILALAKINGAAVGTDPRNADFGKIKIGNARIDLWGGLQQYVRYAAQLISGKTISSTTGKVTTLGEGYKPLTRKDIIYRALESKASPVTGFALKLLQGQDFTGQPINLRDETAQLFIPLVTSDIYSIIKDKGMQGIFYTPLPVFGVGLQTYGPKKPLPTKQRTSLNSTPPKVKTKRVY